MMLSRSILILALALAAMSAGGAESALAWTWPVSGPVLQAFSLGPDVYAGGQHRGIDVAAPSGASVAAPAAGTVTFAGSVPGGGRTVTIHTVDGYAVTLVHLGAVAVAKGVGVREGQVVGTVGPSGVPELEEPYVHLGIRVASDPHGYVDPLGLLPPAGATRPAAAPATDGGAGQASPEPELETASQPVLPEEGGASLPPVAPGEGAPASAAAGVEPEAGGSHEGEVAEVAAPPPPPAAAEAAAVESGIGDGAAPLVPAEETESRNGRNAGPSHAGEARGAAAEEAPALGRAVNASARAGRRSRPQHPGRAAAEVSGRRHRRAPATVKPAEAAPAGEGHSPAARPIAVTAGAAPAPGGAVDPVLVTFLALGLTLLVAALQGGHGRPPSAGQGRRGRPDPLQPSAAAPAPRAGAGADGLRVFLEDDDELARSA